MSYTAAVITISDKGYAGLREDTSGPALCELLRANDWSVIYTGLVPDEAEMIKAELLKCSDELGVNLVLTTGGTGFSPRDITPEATKAIIERETPGIPELMRAESMKITPHGCLSRSFAGIRKRSLIINLPGSKKASVENMEAVIGPVRHGIDMLMSEGSANCAENAAATSQVPSTDEWLRVAKEDPSASQCGMYLFHNGVVRETAKAQARFNEDAAPVKGMLFSFDKEKVDTAIAATREMPGIHYVRVWLNEGKLDVQDTIMLVLIGGDIRPNVTAALDSLVGELKNNCVTETEIQ